MVGRSQSPRRKSPRRRRPKPPQVGQAAVGAPEVRVPQAKSLPAPPQATAISGPKAAPSTAAPSNSSEKQASDQILKAMSASKESLSPELQELLAHHKREAIAAKSLHRAVSAQAAARRELTKVRNSGAQYSMAWAAYIEQVTATVQAQVTQHAEVMSGFAEKEAQWEQSLADATSELSKLATEGVVEVVDSEAEDAMVDAALAAEQEVAQAQARQQERNNDFLQGLRVGTRPSQRSNGRDSARAHSQEGQEGRQSRRGAPSIIRPHTEPFGKHEATCPCRGSARQT